MPKIIHPQFRTPRKLRDAVWTEGRLLLGGRLPEKAARWPWIVLALAPFIGVAAAWIWHNLS